MVILDGGFLPGSGEQAGHRRCDRELCLSTELLPFFPFV
jgi:hypothetical protein